MVESLNSGRIDSGHRQWQHSAKTFLLSRCANGGASRGLTSSMLVPSKIKSCEGCNMPINNALRREWQKAGYRTTMGSSAVVPPPPEHLVRVYHLTPAEFAISDIESRRIKVARFSDLNDPFELMALNLRERHVRKVMRNFKREQNDHTGLLCFSADWTNPVLWSHYAAKHRGICLGFDLKRECTQHVQYEDE